MKPKEIAMSTFTSSSSRPMLPPNFAMKIIEKEIELEKSWSSSIISELVELYSQAIEFYNYNNDPKCYDYQDRMHKMLLKPQVMNSLSGKTPSPSKKRENHAEVNSTNEHIQDIEKNRKLMAAELNTTLSVTSHKTERNIIKTISDNETNTKEVAEKLADNFKMQDTDLLSRLENRRKLNKTLPYEVNQNDITANLSLNNTLDVIESDKSGGYSISKAERNKKIEEMMEKHFAEKAAKIAEINVKYEKEILEMQEDGVMALVISQMRVNMKEEIDAVSKEFDAKRKAEILRLKKEFR